MIKKKNYGWIKFFSVLFPAIGIVFYFIEVDKNEKKADACLYGIIISFILSIAVGLVSLVVYFSLRDNYENDYYYDFDYSEESNEIIDEE